MRLKFQDFLGNKRGNVAMLFAILLVPMTFVTGMGIDYASAARKRSKLNAAADAAALSAITPPMMKKTAAQAQVVAQNMFNAQASGIPGLNYSLANLTINVTDTGTTRTVAVNYQASSQNTFGGILGKSSIPIAGKSQSSATAAPNIDYYMLLDTSPSMAIAATTAGINTMVANTSSQGGCAFACHQTNPAGDNLGNPGGIDNYQLARNLNVALRIDLVVQAVQNLTSTAQTTENANNATYRMGIYTFDYAFRNVAPLSASLSTVQSQASNVQLLQVYQNSWLTSSNNNNDTDTNYDAAMSGINAVMPNPGNGTSMVGDTPQKVLFFVTDGVVDEQVGASRQQSLMDNGWCTTIKNRGIRIAVLYTTYLPLPTNSWYNTYIAPFQPQIGPTLQSCASPGLFFQVSTDGDISAAMTALFQQSVATARLTK